MERNTLIFSSNIGKAFFVLFEISSFTFFCGGGSGRIQKKNDYFWGYGGFGG